MDNENFKKVLNQITKHPETWDQKSWHCGTTHCFAGWAQLLSGNPANFDTVRRDARIYLDLSGRDADFLFDSLRTQDDFLLFLDGYNHYGHVCDGYNGYGFYCDEYDCDGYDRDGLDRNNKPK